MRLDREPRVAPSTVVVDETAAAVEDIEEVEEEVATEETLNDPSSDAKKSTTKATLNGNASARLDDVRTMFTMEAEVSLRSFISSSYI